MKHSLLTAAAIMMASVAFAQEGTDFTPSQYKYGERTSTGQELIQQFYTGANPNAAVVRNDALAGFNNGYFFVAGGQFANPAQPYAKDLQAGTSIVDLGGEVGKVLCINGVNSKFNDTYSMDYPQCTGGLNWFNFDWSTDPENTPAGGTAEAPNIRVSITLNIFSNTPSAANAVINKVYAQDAENNVQPNGSNGDTGVEVYTGDFVETYEDGEPVLDDDENMIYDPTKWMVYEWDARCPEAVADATFNQYAPLRIKMEMNAGNLAGATMFIKEVKLTQLENNTDPIVGKRVKTFKTYKVDPKTITSAISQIESTGNTAKQIFTIDGKSVNADQNLAKGVYIVKEGNKVSKVAVK